MPAITDLADAVTKVKAKCSADTTPTLTDAEVEEVLEDFELGTEWAADTAYKMGDKVIATDENNVGRLYECVNPGTSGAEEPPWDDYVGWSNSVQNGVVVGNLGSNRIAIPDGDVVWRDIGPIRDLWHIDDAVSECWRRKAGKVSDLYNTTRAGNNHDLEAIYRHCMEQANSRGGAFLI